MAKVSSSGLSSGLAGGADTIVARATPAGRGGLAVIRVSGPGCRAVVEVMCPTVDVDRGWRATLATVRDGAGDAIDQGVVTVFPAPRSYTGEDMVEIAIHGSPWLVGRALDAAKTAGARPARPGEFTRRAVANGRLDLVQAEAINDLVVAETAWQARLARAQLAGALSREFEALRGGLVAALAGAEGALDFAQHEVEYDLDSVRAEVAACLDQARALLATAAAGRQIRDGLRVAILGAPNSGKSTLFNCLVGRQRAIVSPHPGTTRDVVEAEIEVAGVAVVLQDTAGVGVAGDAVEEEGIRRARGVAADADLVLVLWPADGRWRDVPAVGEGRPRVAVRSKWDLAVAPVEDGWLAVSCWTGDGVDGLRRAMADIVGAGVADLGGEVAIGERHRRALEGAVAELEGADLGRPELAAEALREALSAVAELTGEVATEEVLDRVFATFCIGK